MGLDAYKPGGWKIDTPRNQAAIASMAVLTDTCRDEGILEDWALICGSFHNLLIDLGCMKGLILREEGVLGIREGTTRGITIVSRMSQPVCFITTGFQKDDADNPIAVLSRRVAQEKYRREYIERLCPGDVTSARVTHLEVFGALADIDCGVISLLPIDAVSVLRISRPRERFTVGMDVHTIIRSIEGDRTILIQEELLDTREENVVPFHTGETVAGIIRSTEPYRIFVKLAPNLAGLAGIKEDVLPGQQASVYVKSILPSRMKIKLVIIGTFDYSYRPIPPEYFFKGDRMDHFVYSPEYSDK